MDIFLDRCILSAWGRAQRIRSALRVLPRDPHDVILNLALLHVQELPTLLRALSEHPSTPSIRVVLYDAWNQAHNAEWSLVRYALRQVPAGSSYWQALRAIVSLKQDLFAALCAAHHGRLDPQ